MYTLARMQYRDVAFLSSLRNAQNRYEKYEEKLVRFRTIGDATCTGAVLSEAAHIEDIISEVAATRTTERGGRADDKRSDSAMEDRKKQGYF